MNRIIAWIPGALLLAVFVPVAAGAQVKTKAMTHDLEGRENCAMCHAVGAMPNAPDIPENHEGRGGETCLWCHGPESRMVTVGAPQFAHELEGRQNCALCHAAGVMPQIPDIPEDHDGRDVKTCLWCHTKAGLFPNRL